MTYQSPESLIRRIMAGNLSESTASANMAPALKTDDHTRLTAAAEVLKASGVGSAAIKDNTIVVSAAEMNTAANILDAAFQHGMITVKPLLASAEAIPMPVAHNPAMAAEETVEEARENETEINQGSVDADGKVKLEPRSLNNRTQNQIKKIDEEEQIDEISKGLAVRYMAKSARQAHTDTEKTVKRRQGFGLAASKVSGRGEDTHDGYEDTGAKGKVDKNTGNRKAKVKATGKLKPHEVKSFNSHYADHHHIKEDEQLDEISKKTVGKYIRAASDDLQNKAEDRVTHMVGLGDKKPTQKSNEKHLRKTIRRRVGIHDASRKLDGSAKVQATEEVLVELKYGTLKSYEKKGSAQVADAASKNKLDRKIARRAAYIAKAKESSGKKLSKAAFGEEATPIDMIKRVRMIAEGKGRLTATFKSDCGKHTAKCYHDSEWGEHRVEFHINGKHHEPADSHHGDKEDAHHTAKAELHRMTKLNGALKEAIEANEDLAWIEEEFEQLDELSKATIRSYKGKAGWSAGQAAHYHDNAVVAGDEKAAKTHGKTYKKRETGLKLANKKLKEAAEDSELPFQQIDELKQIGAYTNDAGHKLTVHRNPNDPKHHLVSHAGKVVDYHHGDAKDLHKKLTKDGFKGSISEEQIDELSKGLLGRYKAKAEKSSEAHGTAGQNYQKMGAHKAADAHFKKGYKRYLGAGRAGAKRNKEGMEMGATKVGGKHDTRMYIDHEGNGHTAKVLAKEEAKQIDELSRSTVNSYVSKARFSKKYHEKAAAKIGSRVSNKVLPTYGHAKDSKDAKVQAMRKHDTVAVKRERGIGLAANKLSQRTPKIKPKHDALHESILTEAKADVEKAKKHMIKHPEANAIGKSLMTAAKHHNYVQDAVDHVYNNHSKELSYEDFDKMRPHFEDHFKKSGLK